MRVISAVPASAQSEGFSTVRVVVEVGGRTVSGLIDFEVDGRDIELVGFPTWCDDAWDWDEFWASDENTKKVEDAIALCGGPPVLPL